jgi:hypothetical protein
MFPEIVSEKKEEVPSIKRLVFDKNWNNKLLCFCFTVIVPESDKFEIGEKLDIRIKDRFFCYATISDIKTFKLSEIIAFGYNMTDCGLEQKDFTNLMLDKYGKKKWWNWNDTKMKLVFLSKVEQLDLAL